MTALASPTSIQRPVVRCGICSREINPDSAVIPVFGRVGGRCRVRHAAMAATLTREGLGEFLNGPVSFEPIESEDAHGVSMWVYPAHIQRLKDRAARLGFRVLDSWPRTDGPASLELKLPHQDKARNKLLKRLERAGVVA